MFWGVDLGDSWRAIRLGQFGFTRVCTDKLTGVVSACKSIAKDRPVTFEDARSVKLSFP